MEVSAKPQAPAILPHKRGPRDPLNRRLGGPRSRSGRFERDKSFYHAGIRTQNLPVSRVVTILTTLVCKTTINSAHTEIK
jgi:hypothetical protein